MSGATFKQRQGTTETWTITLGRDDGTPLAYTGAEAPAFRLWPGEGWPTALAVPGAWNPAPNAVDVTIRGSDLASVEVGEYLAELIFDDGAGGIGWSGRFAVEPAPSGPGGTPLRTYCGRADLLAEFPDAARYRRESDGLNFERQRAEAARWLEDALHARYRPGASYDWSPAAASHRARIWWPTGTPGRSAVLERWLAEGRLVVNDHVRRACAFHSLGLILARQFAAGHEESVQRKLGRQYLARAESELKTLVVEIDTSSPPDGRGDLSIDLGRAS